MHRRKYLTEPEAAQVERLAVELVTEHCRAQPGFLQGLVRTYLGTAETAAGAVIARCQADPAYLGSIVESYIADLDEREVLDELASLHDPKAIAGRLGFDPFDVRRREAHRLASQFVNATAQRRVLAVAAVLFVLMALFPPWQMVRRERVDPCASAMCQPDRTVEVRFAGFYFISSPPTGSGSQEWTSPSSRSTYVIYRVYWEMLLLQLLGLVIFTVAVLVGTRDGRSFEARVAALTVERAPAPARAPSPWVEPAP